VIVRVMGEGQFELADELIDELNRQDERVAAALESNDEPAFREALQALVGMVVAQGARLPDHELVASDVVLPRPDASIEEVSELLGEDGLVPG
jgi:soluble P-type ATPase